MLISILSLSLTAFSQTGTNKVPTKCFPIPTVKLIVKDLMSGDSAKAQLKLVEQQLVTAYIKNSTENLVESIQFSELQTQKAGNLAHLKTDITGKLKSNISESNKEIPLYFDGACSRFDEMPLPSQMTPIIYRAIKERKIKPGFKI